MGAGGWAQQYARGWGQELEGLDPGGPRSGWRSGPGWPLVQASRFAVGQAPGPTGSSPGAPGLHPLRPVRPSLTESLSDTRSPEGPSTLHFCFHNLLGPCLLEASLTASALWPGCPAAPCCPQATDLPPGRPLTPTPGGPRTQAGTIAGLPSGSGYQRGPAALPGRGSPHPHQGKAMRSPRISGPAPLQG